MTATQREQRFHLSCNGEFIAAYPTLPDALQAMRWLQRFYAKSHYQFKIVDMELVNA